SQNNSEDCFRCNQESRFHAHWNNVAETQCRNYHCADIDHTPRVTAYRRGVADSLEVAIELHLLLRNKCQSGSRPFVRVFLFSEYEFEKLRVALSEWRGVPREIDIRKAVSKELVLPQKNGASGTLRNCDHSGPAYL